MPSWPWWLRNKGFWREICRKMPILRGILAFCVFEPLAFPRKPLNIKVIFPAEIEAQE
jgi:hypothetical protein